MLKAFVILPVCGYLLMKNLPAVLELVLIPMLLAYFLVFAIDLSLSILTVSQIN